MSFFRRISPWWLTFALVAILHAWSLLRYPPPFVDEAWLTSRSWAFLQTGLPFGPLDKGVIDGFPGYWRTNQFIYTAILAVFLKMAGTPSLLAARAMSFTLGVILLLANYYIADRLGGRRLALWSTLLLALLRTFLYSAHLVRYDIAAAVFGYGGIAFILCNPSKKMWMGLVAGLLLGINLDVHLNGLVFIPAALALFWLDERWGAVKQPHFWTFTLGGLLGAGWYAAYHILPDPQAFAALNRLLYASTYTPLILSWSVSSIVTSLKDTVFLIFTACLLLVVLLPFGIYGLAKAKTAGSSKVLWINGILVLGVILFFPNKTYYYSILIAPAFTWIIAYFWTGFIHRPWRGKLTDYLSQVAVLGITAGTLALGIAPLTQNMYAIYQEAQRQVDQVVLPNDTLMGSQTYWFSLTGHPYYSWELLFLYPRFKPGKTLADAFQQFKPDLLILDNHMRGFLYDASTATEREKIYGVDKQELEAYLAKHAQRIRVVDVDYYGYIYIYRFNWSQ